MSHPEFDFDASDVIVVVTPTVCVFEPQNDAARVWLSDNVQDDATWALGGVAVEPRFVNDLIAGIEDSGFQIHGEHAQ